MSDPKATDERDHSADQRLIRVFVSSTFRDMHAERDHLVTVVFPELRERIEQLGMTFFDIDLRWGVPGKDVNGETANPWEYCKQWIERVEPFFVCMLGQRYGWVPEPEQFKDADEVRQQHVENRSITDMEVRYAVLQARLKRRSFFYLRATAAPDASTDFVDPPPLLQKVERLKQEVRACGRPVREYRCRWTGSGFAGMEEFGRQVLEDLWSGVLRDGRYVSREIWCRALGADPDGNPYYTDESHPVPRELWEKLVALAKPEPTDPLDYEREQMAAFSLARRRWFHGRTKELQELLALANGSAADGPRLMAIEAAPGQGKSALLATLWARIPQPTQVIAHFIGATEGSANAQAVVRRLLSELERCGLVPPTEKDAEEAGSDFTGQVVQLSRRLSNYDGSRRIVILLDGLNQLSDGHDLRWLPAKLGPGVRVIVSCVRDAADAAAERVFETLTSLHPSPLRIVLQPLTDRDVRDIIVAYLREYCHELDREHLDALVALQQAHNPLYLLVMLYELRTLSGNDLNQIVPARITTMARDHPDSVSLFDWVLQHLEEAFGADPVRWWCCCLALGREGMASGELADLLARRFGPEGRAIALRIERGVRGYLQRRGAQLDYFHGQLRQAIRQRYGVLLDDAIVHAEVADYFRLICDPQRDLRWRFDRRALGELTFHLAHAGRQSELASLLSQLGFLAARVAAGQVFEQIADYAMAEAPLTAELKLWRDFLQKHAQRLVNHAGMLVSLANHEGFPEAQRQGSALDWQRPWLRTELEPLPRSQTAASAALRAQVISSLHLDWGSVSAIAPDKPLAFRLVQLGMLGVYDMTTPMRQTDLRLEIGPDRPLTLACAPDAGSLAVLYVTGVGALYQCTFDGGGWPSRLDLRSEFAFHVPETEDPIVTWHADGFWYQSAPGRLACVSVGQPQPREQPLPHGKQGELAALLFINGNPLVALQDGIDIWLLCADCKPLRHPATQVSAACLCADEQAAVAFTDGHLTLLSISETLQPVAELRTGIICGAIGWDGNRLLWLGVTGGCMAWCPGETTAQPVQDSDEVFPDRLTITPRQWLLRTNEALLVATTHSLVNLRLLDGGASANGRLEEIHGGQVWQAVRKRNNDQWLLQRGAEAETLLGRDVQGRLYWALDGKERLFAASGYGPGLLFDPAKPAPIPLRDCPPGISAAEGEVAGGCWFVDRRGDIYFADATGSCGRSATVELHDVSGPLIVNCGDHLIWFGHSSKFFADTGNEPARTLLVFDKSPGRLRQVAVHARHPREGICAAVSFDPHTDRLVTLWVKETPAPVYYVRMAGVSAFARWQVQELPLHGLGEAGFEQACLSGDGRWLGILNRHGEVACVSLTDGEVAATLSCSAPFTAIAPGSHGASFWLVEADRRIFHCLLAGGDS